MVFVSWSFWSDSILKIDIMTGEQPAVCRHNAGDGRIAVILVRMGRGRAHVGAENSAGTEKGRDSRRML